MDQSILRRITWELIYLSPLREILISPGVRLLNRILIITTEGNTYQPGSEAAEPDIENCQVLGFAKGDDADAAFCVLLQENAYLLETSFDEVVCLELKDEDYGDRKTYFSIRNSKI